MFLTLHKNSFLFVMMAVFIISGAIVLSCNYFEANEVSVLTNTIIIDPGHGGEDGGAVGKNGTKEKDLNLEIALKLKKIMIENGFNVQLTREKDTMLCDPEITKHKKRTDLNNRVKISRKFDNGIFLSIHMNHFEDPNQKGSQVFYSVNNKNSKMLAELIEKELKASVDAENKRVSKPAENNIFIMKHINIPACLIECGFISNRIEEKLLADPTYQEKIANAIATGVKNFIRTSAE